MNSRFAIPVLVLCALLFWAVASASGCDRLAFSAQAVIVRQQAVVVSAVPVASHAVAVNSHCFVPSAVTAQVLAVPGSAAFLAVTYWGASFLARSQPRPLGESLPFSPASVRELNMEPIRATQVTRYGRRHARQHLRSVLSRFLGRLYVTAKKAVEPGIS